MANPQEDELVFCHSCENEWMREEHGLQCPQCHSDAVEIIDPTSDPRAQDGAYSDLGANEYYEPPPYGGRSRPGREEAPDPDEDDIRHIEYGGHGGTHYSTTFIRSSTGGHQSTQVVTGGDLFPQLLSNLLGTLQPQQPSHLAPDEVTRSSPLQEGPFRTAAPPRSRATIQIRTGVLGSGGMRTQEVASDDIMGIFGSLLQGIGGGHGGFASIHGTAGHAPMPPNPFNLLASMIDPANARSGDAVFTNQALDRVISQLMEQHSGSTAPGPATEAAIAALPKISVTKEHLGENGLVECSICMDSVEVGAEVTELPCKHWFHGDCVGPWLREHDTCPQCRRGITPKEGDADRPRATGQAPRFWQMSEADFRPESEAAPEANPASAGPSNLSPTGASSTSPSVEASHRSRSRSSSRRSHDSRPSESRGFASGLSSIMDRLRGGSGSSSSGSHSHGHDSGHHRYKRHRHHDSEHDPGRE